MTHQVKRLTLRAYIGVIMFGGFLLTCAHAHSPHDVVNIIAISPGYKQDQTLFIYVFDELKRSTDGGHSWKNLENGLGNNTLISDISASSENPAEYKVFIATRGDGVYRSDDRGDSWHPVNAGLENPDIRHLVLSQDFDHDHTLVAIPQGTGLFVSTTAGDSWRKIAINEFTVTSVSVIKDKGKNRLLAGTDKGEIYLSGEQFNSWSRQGEITAAGRITSISKLVKDKTGQVTYVGTELNGLYKTDDLGASYSRIDISPTLASKDKAAHVTSITTLEGARGTADVFVTLSNEAVFFSTDGGENWTKLGEGLKKNIQADERKVPHFYKVAIPPEYALHGNAFVAGFSGLFKTADRGKTWVEVETRPAGNIEGIAVSPSYSSDHLVSLATYDGGAYVSMDSGKSWTTRNTGLRSTHLWDIAIASNESKVPTLFAISNLSFLSSPLMSSGWSRNEIAASASWKFVIENFDEGSIVTRLARRMIDRPDFLFLTRIEVSPDFSKDATILLGTRYKGILKTTDAGSTWVNPWLADNGWISSLKISPNFSTDDIVVASVRKKGFYLSSDRGETWTSRNEGLSPQAIQCKYLGTSVIELSPGFAKDGRIYFGTADGLYLSVNRGQNWEKLNVTGEGLREHVRAVGISPDFANDGTILVSIKGRGLFKSTDKGRSFIEIAPELILGNELIKLIRFSPEYAKDRSIFAASPEEAYVSHDTGGTWMRLKRPVRYENTKDNIVYTGVWRKQSNNAYSALNIHRSNTPGSEAVFYFVGNQATWYGPKSEEYGMANVYLDGELVGKVDQFAAEPKNVAPIFTISDLPRGSHVLTIEVANEKNENASDNYIAIDAFEES